MSLYFQCRGHEFYDNLCKFYNFDDSKAFGFVPYLTSGKLNLFVASRDQDPTFNKGTGAKKLLDYLSIQNFNLAGESSRLCRASYIAGQLKDYYCSPKYSDLQNVLTKIQNAAYQTLKAQNCHSYTSNFTIRGAKNDVPYYSWELYDYKNISQDGKILDLSAENPFFLELMEEKLAVPYDFIINRIPLELFDETYDFYKRMGNRYALEVMTHSISNPYKASHPFTQPELLEAAIKWKAKNFSTFTKAEYSELWLNLTSDEVLQILSHRKFKVKREFDLFYFIRSWCNHNVDHQKALAPNLARSLFSEFIRIEEYTESERRTVREWFFT